MAWMTSSTPVIEEQDDGLEQPSVGVEAEAQFPRRGIVVDRVGDQESAGGLDDVGVVDAVFAG